jgi:hypothetical protein
MSDKGATKLRREAVKLLKRSGLDFELREASNHTEVIIDGRKELAISRGGKSAGRDCDVLRSIIRRKGGKI